MERTAIYAGSFDPVTEGHLDILRRGLTLFDRVIVVITHNPDKRGCFTVPEREALLRKCTRDMPGVSVDSWSGLTTAYARRVGACAMLRGLRDGGDWQAEQRLALINRRLCPEAETVFLTALPEHMAVSSSAVRELASYGAPLTGYVPACIEEDIRARFAEAAARRNWTGV